MMHNYTLKHETARFSVWISPSTNYGYFENNLIGDEFGGGMWFAGKELIDADGTDYFPSEVAAILMQLGYAVENAFIEDWGKTTNCRGGRVRFDSELPQKPWICFVQGTAINHFETWSEVVEFFNSKGMKI